MVQSSVAQTPSLARIPRDTFGSPGSKWGTKVTFKMRRGKEKKKSMELGFRQISWSEAVASGRPGASPERCGRDASLAVGPGGAGRRRNPQDRPGPLRT